MYLIHMETERHGEKIKGWYSGTAFGIKDLAMDGHIFKNKEFCESIAKSLSGTKKFLHETFYIKTKVVEVKR